jgi:predicted metalloprotease
MDWKPGGVSDDVEDRRSSGGFSGMGMGGRGIGIGGFLVLLVLSLVFHRNLFTLISGDVSPDGVGASAPASDSAQDAEVQFVSFVLDDV